MAHKAYIKRLRGLARSMRREILHHALPRARSRRLSSADSARVIGLLSSASGLGNSSRLCMASLKASGVSVDRSNVAAYFKSDDGLPFENADVAAAHQPACSIYHLNPPMLLRGFIADGLSRYYASYNIGYWAWELEQVPSEWQRATNYVDAIFVPTQFCADAIAKVTDKPVLVVPHPVTGTAGSFARRPERSQRSPFTVLCVFNFGSSFERKNPLAMIEAFKRAFKSGEAVQLILKTSDGARYRGDFERLQRAIAGQDNIKLVDAVWTNAQMASAFAAADAYLSLHRSEGFGLSIAEAIAMETPVVATGWSGNTDFCHPDATYLTDYSLVPFRDEHGDYAEVASARWAEANVDHAARSLRAIRDEPEAARAKAAAARTYLNDHLARKTYASALQALVADAAVRGTVRRDMVAAREGAGE